jgi:hypothetical protein
MDLGRLTYVKTEDIDLRFMHPELGECQVLWSTTFRRMYIAPTSWDFHHCGTKEASEKYPPGAINSFPCANRQLAERAAQFLHDYLPSYTVDKWANVMLMVNVACLPVRLRVPLPPLALAEQGLHSTAMRTHERVERGDDRPPRVAEYLFHCILGPAGRTDTLGDLEEEYREIEARNGRRAAVIWYWQQFFWSLSPLARRAAVLWLLAELRHWFGRINQ